MNEIRLFYSRSWFSLPCKLKLYRPLLCPAEIKGKSVTDFSLAARHTGDLCELSSSSHARAPLK